MFDFTVNKNTNAKQKFDNVRPNINLDGVARDLLMVKSQTGDNVNTMHNAVLFIVDVYISKWIIHYIHKAVYHHP